MADQTGAVRLVADAAPVDAAPVDAAPVDAARSEALLESEALVEPADLWSILDQAAADESITDARHRAVEPVRSVTADEERPRDNSDNQIPENEIPDNKIPDNKIPGNKFSGAPISGARRKWSPRPVPGIRRKRKPQQAVPATDMEPIPAEEMDVGTHDDKAAAAAGAEKAVIPVEAEETPAGETGPNGRNATATVTKPARPQTAAEIVAAQKAAREKAAEEAAAGKPAADTGMTTPVTRQPAVPSTSLPTAGAASASSVSAGSSTAGSATAGSKAPAGNPLVSAKAAREKKGGQGKSKAAMSAVGSGVAKLRNSIASLVWLIAVLAAGVLALGALFTALDQTNQSNEIVSWILARGHELVGPFKDLFRLETAKNTLLVNWGIAALVYLIAGKIVERFIRP